jgi:hypothetical protein
MSKYYDRRYEVFVNGDKFIGQSAGLQFRTVFEVVHDFGGFVSYGDIALYNLKEETAKKLYTINGSIELRAGYADTINTVFKGTMINTFRERDNANTLHRILARGGSQSTSVSIEETLGKGSTVEDAVRACALAMGYPVVGAEALASLGTYIRGLSLHGDPRQYMNSLAKQFGFSYTIENDRIVVMPDNGTRNVTPIIVSAQTGMEGIPEITEIGCKIRMRLRPDVQIGGRIQIEAGFKSFNFNGLYFKGVPRSAGTGEYRIFQVKHSGDSHGDTWTTTIEGFR